ncbi:MAG: PD-(D/E)XK nuclease family protein [Halobacteriales archaeon]|nr:PD-(D/E)XK nuclease family protein [Halobacteriales archaeon]
MDSLDGELHAEQPALLPLEVDGATVAISGVVDLVAVSDERVTLVDYKTDRSRRAAEEYRKQVSVYYHVVAAAFPGRESRGPAVLHVHQGRPSRSSRYRRRPWAGYCGSSEPRGEREFEGGRIATPSAGRPFTGRD